MKARSDASTSQRTRMANYHPKQEEAARILP